VPPGLCGVVVLVLVVCGGVGVGGVVWWRSSYIGMSGGAAGGVGCVW